MQRIFTAVFFFSHLKKICYKKKKRKKERQKKKQQYIYFKTRLHRKFYLNKRKWLKKFPEFLKRQWRDLSHKALH
jgi:hypothetical protein